MVRDLTRLADTRWDLLVVGAGIYGCAVACDAARRGLHVALIDRGDLGSGASFHSLKTVHGGLRSLQSLNLVQMRRFIRERRALARTAPHLLRPLPFLVPTALAPQRSAWVMRRALALNDLVANDRNDGIADPTLHLPHGDVLDRTRALEHLTALDPDGITGAARWWDYQMVFAERVHLAHARTAAAHGACIASYVAATGLLREHARVAGVTAHDWRSDRTFDIHARIVINTTGASSGEVARWAHSQPPENAAPALSRAMNLVLDLPAGAHAQGGRVDGRFLFLVPWGHVTMLGTSHDVSTISHGMPVVTGADVDQFIADGRRAFPRAAITRERVRLVHRGLLPMTAGHGTQVSLVKESAVVDHADSGAPGLISVHSVRYTTARHTAEEAVTGAFKALGYETPPASTTDRAPLVGGDIADLASHDAAVAHAAGGLLSAEHVARVSRAYGTEAFDVIARMQHAPALAHPLSEACPVTGAELLHGIEVEGAVTLADALIRRTSAGTSGCPDDVALSTAAALMGAHQAWSVERQQREQDEVREFYRVTSRHWPPRE
jgi:glycerol-3-phosphate dehydrogenase